MHLERFLSCQNCMSQCFLKQYKLKKKKYYVHLRIAGSFFYLCLMVSLLSLSEIQLFPSTPNVGTGTSFKYCQVF